MADGEDDKQRCYGARRNGARVCVVLELDTKFSRPANCLDIEMYSLLSKQCKTYLGLIKVGHFLLYNRLTAKKIQ
jgi:hypothetical protein